MRAVLLVLSLAVGCGGQDSDSSGEGFFGWVQRRVQPRDPYALDDMPRSRDPAEELECDRESLERYEGEHVEYARALNVDPAFVERLERFEELVHELAIETYGRGPRRVLHVGAFACRTVRGREERISEHALGNALDVTGFSFGRWHPPETPDGVATEMGGAEAAPPEPPPESLRRPFRVTVREHWDTDDEADQVHRAFLRTLAGRLQEERVFRSMIGPSQAGHAGHLHLGMPPWRYIRL